MSPFKIALLSDQHIDMDVAPASWDRARAAFRTAVEQRADHVILAGDTFDCATAMTRDAPSVRRYLKRLGLWSRDRLSIVPGNHDYFHTPHHGSMPQRLAEVAKIPLRRAQKNHDFFCEWIDELIAWEDLCDPEQVNFFPHHKILGHVHLWVADTNARTTAHSGNGFWYEYSDDWLRESVEEAFERRVLAIHHPPSPDQLHEILDLVKGTFPYGFPPEDFESLRAFLRDAEIEAVLCGHVHHNGGAPYRWPVGRARVFMMGRTGGMHGRKAVIGILEVPERGRMRWRDIRVE